MRTLTLDEWRDLRCKDLAPDEKIECPECYGMGEVECDHCEQHSECSTCDGDGKLLAGDCTESEIRNSLTRKQYADALEHDLTDLASFTGKNRIKTLTDHGLKCYSLIDTKREIVEMT